MTNSPEPTANRWAEAWPDALAFAGGLALAWWAGWATSDLVWSLWLSSLVVGYALIVWTLFGPLLRFGRRAAEAMAIKVNGKELALGAMGPAAVVFGSLFLLAFFTFHFGLFHFVHSVFLKTFLPIEGYDARSMPGPGYYWEVVRRYWLFLPLAFLAERQAFRLSLPADPGKRDTAVTAGASAERQAGKAKPGGMNDMMAPYKNVVRMHLLIFFFAFAHFAKLESFLVYAVVYAAYFFPWRLLGKKAIPAA